MCLFSGCFWNSLYHCIHWSTWLWWKPWCIFLYASCAWSLLNFLNIWAYSFFFPFIFISWRLITLQYYSGFCHTLTWISHGFTCVPHPDASSCLPLHPIPLGLASAPAYSVQFSPVIQSCLTRCNPMNRSTQGLPVHHQLPEFIQTHVHRVSDAIQPSHPLLSPSPPALNLSQHQGLF